MSAPLNLTNRFELLLTNNPANLPRVLDIFAKRNISPTAVNAVSQGNHSLSVTVIVKNLGEAFAITLQKKLKTMPGVKAARLEHMVN